MKLFVTALSLIALTTPSVYAYNTDRDGEYRDGVAGILYPDQQPSQTSPRPDVGSILYPPSQPTPQPVYTPPPQPVVVTPPPAAPAPPPTIVVVPQPAPAPAPEPELIVPTVGDTNSCVEGSVIGAVVGGAGAAAANEYLWNGDYNNLIWGIPAGALLGGLVGCQIDGG
jgi:hypothetical protein